MRKWIKRIFLFIIVSNLIIILAGASFYWYSLPRFQGKETVAGLQGKVNILRDRYGVPHITAEASDLDAFFALGYVHAQDRLWQMEFQRHVAQGTLSEIFGEKTLQQDEYLRTWGFYRAAEQSWSALSPQAKSIIESYTAGVNAYLQEKRYPLQIHVLNYQPKPWTVIDSIAWQKMMAWDLQNIWEAKLKNYLVETKEGASQIPVLFPAYPKNAPTVLSEKDLQQSGLTHASIENESSSLDQKITQNTLEGLEKTTQVIRHHLRHEVTPGIGSNAWVVSGKWTVSGKPLLANDPHLALQAPSVWYLAELNGPHLHVIGATLPGLPGVVIGHNDHIAWGITNVNPDVQDLYLLPSDALLKISTEVIKVRNHPDVNYLIAQSNVGPVINQVEPLGTIKQAVAIKWTALMPGDTTVQSMLEINYAENWSSFVSALKDFVTPSQNFVYADKEGNIGYYMSGHIPVRKWDSHLPVSDDINHQWSGMIPFEKLPHVFNPEEGMITTANNRVVDDNYPYPITFRWQEPPYRAERILHLLKTLRPLNAEKMGVIQNDIHSNLWDSLAPHLLQTTPLDASSALALNILRQWNGDVSLNSVPATIFAFWYGQLASLTPPTISSLSRWPESLFIAKQLASNGSYCVRKDAKNCQDYLSKSLEIAMQKLEQALGRDPKKWEWSRVHKAEFSEVGLGIIPGVGDFWNRSIPTPGGFNTVNVGTYQLSNFVQVDGASYRQIVDLASRENSRYVLSLGQSQDALSGHYQDQLPLWRAGEYLPMRTQPEQWSKTQKLVLMPLTDH